MPCDVATAAALADGRYCIRDDARRALDVAVQHARDLGHDHVGSLHLLLALRTAIPSAAAFALKTVGIEPDQILFELHKVPRGHVTSAANEDLAVTPFVQRLFERAATEAREHGDAQIGSEHLLHALLRENEDDSVGVAVEFLLGHGVNVESVLRELGVHIRS